MTSCLANAEVITLTGVQNVRQLGGYLIGDKAIRADVLLRSANLSAATDSDLLVLHDTYHVAQVFDFRSTIEHESAPDRIIEECEYFWLPCLEQAVQGMGKEISSKPSNSGSTSKIGEAILQYLNHPQVKQMAENLYPMIVFDEKVQQNYASFLRTLVSLPDGHAALWHCTQGKDRAGCATAFLLAALGADRTLIVDDFAKSNKSYQELINKLINKIDDDADGSKANIIYALIGVSVKNFERTLDAIDARYGSLDNYLTEALNCDALLRDALRKKFLNDKE